MTYTILLQFIDYIQDNVHARQIFIVIVYAFLAVICDLFINKILRRLTAMTKSSLDDHLVKLINKPAKWTIFCAGILHALLLTPSLPPPWQIVLPSLVKSVILFIWLIAAYKALEQILQTNTLEKLFHRRVNSDVFGLIIKLSKIFLIVSGILLALSIWKVNLTPLFASAGIAGIAIALAAKDTLANLFGGISVFMDNAFKDGDYIILESGERGEVVDIGLRSTRIKTRDDVMISVPNSIMSSTKIINESKPEPRFRIRIPVSVAYGSDIDKVERLLLDAANSDNRVVVNPESRVRFRAFGNSSLDFELLCWVHEPSMKGLAIHEILKRINSAFSREKIEIPFPQMDVHLEKPSADTE